MLSIRAILVHENSSLRSLGAERTLLLQDLRLLVLQLLVNLRALAGLVAVGSGLCGDRISIVSRELPMGTFLPVA